MNKIPKILIVDDNRDILILIKHILEQKLNAEIYTALSGKEAIDIINEHKPDILIVDYILSDIDGVEVIKKIKEHPIHSKIKTILLTGFKEKFIKNQININIDAIVEKKFNAGKLIDNLKNIIISFLNSN